MEKFHRKDLRLQEYDYSQNGAYFITICVENRRNILWNSLAKPLTDPAEQPPLSRVGQIVNTSIQNISQRYPYVTVDKYVIMPNHVHMILVISKDEGPALSISHIISQFKGYVTKTLREPIWQKGFYERIIRNDKEFGDIWDYIDVNAINWEKDTEYM